MPRSLECSYHDVESLAPLELARLLRRLLYLEAQAAGIPTSAVQASLKIDVPDGGEDGRIQWQGEPTYTKWLPSRFCLFQSKAKDLNPSDCKREVLNHGTTQLKPRVKEVLDAGGTYILFYGRDCNMEHQVPRIEKIREAIREAGELYADTCQLVIRDANQIAAWASEYLSATVQVFAAVNKPLPPSLENWSSWCGFSGFSKFAYVSGDIARDTAISQVRAHLSKGPKRTARLVGLSGLGKTRLALEVFRPPEDPVAQLQQQMLSEQVIYINAEDAGTELLPAIHSWRQEGMRAILVVDNCDKELHKRIALQVEHADSQLNLLTIGPDPETGATSSEDFPYIQLGAAEDSIIVTMLKRHYAALPEADLNFIAKELARGFPQMAVLIADARLQNRDIHDAVENDLLRKLLGAPPDAESQAFQVISHCALFEHLGVTEASAKEYKWAAAFAGVDSDRFYEHIERFKARGILSKHGNFVQVRPAPLAMRLAADWWRGCSPEKAERLIVGDIPDRLAEALCGRIRVLDYVPAVRQFVERLCGEQRPFGQAKVLNSELGSQLFRSFVEVNPEATARALKSAFAGWSIDDFKSVGPGRRNLVWALQNLCFWKSTFPKAASVLLSFAAAENEDWTNNSTGVFLGLFRFVLSGTQAEPKDRFVVINDALDHRDERCRVLAVRALGHALQTGHFVGMAGPEQQGSRFPEQEWRPKYYKDAFDYWAEALSRLASIAMHDDALADIAKREIADHIRDLASVGRVKELDEALVPIIEESEGFWPEALGQVQDIKEYDFDRMPDEGKALVEKWEKLLEPRQFSKKLALIVTEGPWQHHEDDAGKFVDVAAEKATAFATEVSKKIDELLPLLPGILVGSQRQAYPFGYRLAQLATQPKGLLFSALTALEDIDASKANPSLLMGMFAALQDINPALFDEALGYVERSENLRVHITNITRASRLSEQQLERMLRLIEGKLIAPGRLQGLSYGRGLDHIAVAFLSEFCNRLVVLGQDGAWAALDVLFMYAHGEPKKWEGCRQSFRRIAFVPDMLLAELGKQRIDTHAFQRIVVKLLQTEDAELASHISSEIVKVARHESSRYDLDDVLRPIIEILFSKYIDVVWPTLAGSLLEDLRTEYYLSHLLGSRFGVGEHPGLISRLDVAYLLAWCDRNPKQYPALLAKMVNIAERKEGQAPTFTPIAKALIDRYGSEEKVLDALGVNIGSFSWVGSLVPYYQEQVQLAAPLVEHPISQVREWAEKLISYARQQAQRERDRDAEREIGLY
ncbi:MAG: hypothetical protein A3H32_14680 [Betaproteobacteria bacterium RIFCSPLOWO2_02_FULL_63_19]|nr:MAG: hypothetical protein A3H32_14680 [Betaproteobacteria bacterium RIFCSPLOWO2_02_FULL_63_19]